MFALPLWEVNYPVYVPKLNLRPMSRFLLPCLGTFLCLLTSASLLGQLKVDSGARLGVGSDPDPNSRLSLFTGSYNYGVKLRTEPISEAVFYGLHSELYNNGPYRIKRFSSPTA